jgi:hypothetical protein
MPQRPKHIPTHLERTALQWLSSREWSTELHLRPTGPKTIAAMIEKGWIERLPSAASSVRITEAGLAALKVKIPEKR